MTNTMPYIFAIVIILIFLTAVGIFLAFARALFIFSRRPCRPGGFRDAVTRTLLPSDTSLPPAAPGDPTPHHHHHAHHQHGHHHANAVQHAPIDPAPMHQPVINHTPIDTGMSHGGHHH